MPKINFNDNKTTRAEERFAQKLEDKLNDALTDQGKESLQNITGDNRIHINAEDSEFFIDFRQMSFKSDSGKRIETGRMLSKPHAQTVQLEVRDYFDAEEYEKIARWAGNKTKPKISIFVPPAFLFMGLAAPKK